MGAALADQDSVGTISCVFRIQVFLSKLYLEPDDDGNRLHAEWSSEREFDGQSLLVDCTLDFAGRTQHVLQYDG